MQNVELEELRSKKKAAKRTIEAIEAREREIDLHKMDAFIINAGNPNIKDAVNSDQVNYIVGNAEGFLTGFESAVDTVISTLACGFRDIPMTSSELYMLVKLGELKEKAYLMNDRQKMTLEENGWRQDFEDETLLHLLGREPIFGDETFPFPHLWKKESMKIKDGEEE